MKTMTERKNAMVFFVAAVVAFFGALYSLAGIAMSSSFSRIPGDTHTVAAKAWTALFLSLLVASAACMRVAIKRKNSESPRTSVAEQHDR
jgi:heme/copper-type cytochrome/quinol oxidase subunit 3